MTIRPRVSSFQEKQKMLVAFIFFLSRIAAQWDSSDKVHGISLFCAGV
jgi:hypothetical protein